VGLRCGLTGGRDGRLSDPRREPIVVRSPTPNTPEEGLGGLTLGLTWMPSPESESDNPSPRTGDCLGDGVRRAVVTVGLRPLVRLNSLLRAAGTGAETLGDGLGTDACRYLERDRKNVSLNEEEEEDRRRPIPASDGFDDGRHLGGGALGRSSLDDDKLAPVAARTGCLNVAGLAARAGAGLRRG
jgi:hypothetical protein